MGKCFFVAVFFAQDLVAEQDEGKWDGGDVGLSSCLLCTRFSGRNRMKGNGMEVMLAYRAVFFAQDLAQEQDNHDIQDKQDGGDVGLSSCLLCTRFSTGTG